MSTSLRALSALLTCLPIGQSLAHPPSYPTDPHQETTGRTQTKLATGWKFNRWEKNPDGIIYDYRPDLENLTDVTILKPWILPTGNKFIEDPSKRYTRPNSEAAINITFAQPDFNDTSWTDVTVPHDWAIAGPFYTEPDDVAIVGGGMGRLPVFGVGWYRRELDLSGIGSDEQIYLEFGGAMSYAMVWLNGQLVGGWPYPYNSFRLDLSPYVRQDGPNVLAVRLDNPVQSARWYPGGGLYRDVWLVETGRIAIGQWGTKYTTANVTNASAAIELEVQVEDVGAHEESIMISTDVYEVDARTDLQGAKVASFPIEMLHTQPSTTATSTQCITLHNPKLWGPGPVQTPNRYLGVTKLLDQSGRVLDTYETPFGIRTVDYTADNGLLVNGQRIQVQGVNDHHDLGAIGAAFNLRAAERKLQILQEMGTNAIRMSHNPPDPQLLDLTDHMGFLVMDEIFDSWEMNKTTNDFHLIFDDWHEQDLRAMIRRDRNHPSVIAWSFGNEVGEQHYNDIGPEIGAQLRAIVHEEDWTRPSTSSMNYAQPGNNGSLFPTIMDIMSVNYQGEGIRDTVNYSNQSGISTQPAFPLFHEAFADKLMWSSESASAVSTRGTYFFPVTSDLGAPVNDTSGGDSALSEVSAYELYSADFGSSPDKAFTALDRNPYVAGEFVWTGFDYMGEPTPYYTARSSYSGIVDLAGFPKDRFYLYQSRWRPELPVAHILPHWNWPERVGKLTPVHVFTNGDEAELLLNGNSLGKRTFREYQYRLRWDEVVYEPGELRVKVKKDGKHWAESTIRTTGLASAIRLTADRAQISADGLDLSYITADVVDSEGLNVPTANNTLRFTVEGGAEIIATDNGYPQDFVPFPNLERSAFSGKALAIVKGKGRAGKVAVTVSSDGLRQGTVVIRLV